MVSGFCSGIAQEVSTAEIDSAGQCSFVDPRTWSCSLKLSLEEKKGCSEEIGQRSKGMEVINSRFGYSLRQILRFPRSWHSRCDNRGLQCTEFTSQTRELLANRRSVQTSPVLEKGRVWETKTEAGRGILDPIASPGLWSHEMLSPQCLTETT